MEERNYSTISSSFELIEKIQEKKKNLIIFREEVESKINALFADKEKNKNIFLAKTLSKPYFEVELEDEKPVSGAIIRRNKQINNNSKEVRENFLQNARKVKEENLSQDEKLLEEIRNECAAAETIFTVKSSAKETQLIYKNYSGKNRGWNMTIKIESKCCDQIKLEEDFILNYETMNNGIKAPVLEEELDDEVIKQYSENVKACTEILKNNTYDFQYEVDYKYLADIDEEPGVYYIKFMALRIFNSDYSKLLQNYDLNSEIKIQLTEYDLKKAGVFEKESKLAESDSYSKEYIPVLDNNLNYNRNRVFYKNDEPSFDENFLSCFKFIPDLDVLFCKYMVTRNLFFKVMGYLPDDEKSESEYPVTNVTALEAICFCNRLSKMVFLDELYSYNGSPDNFFIEEFGKEKKRFRVVIKESGAISSSNLSLDKSKAGFRLASEHEWYKASNLYWYSHFENGLSKIANIHYYDSYKSYRLTAVGSYKPNPYGLYDIIGNAYELTDSGTMLGGSFKTSENEYFERNRNKTYPCDSGRGWVYSSEDIGFRVVLQGIK